MQRDATGPALALLRQGRASLAGRLLIGLADPELPTLPEAARACLDGLHVNAYAAARAAPSCFVRLAPDPDELFTVPLLLDPVIASVAPSEPEAGALACYWQARTGAVVPLATLWSTVAGTRPKPAQAAERLAVLTAARNAPLCSALRRAGADIFGPARLPPLSPRYDRRLFVIGNTHADAALIRLLRRHGGAALLTESCLLAAYADDPARAARLAERELGRPIGAEEWRQWRDGIARPQALLLGEVADAAEALFVHSQWLADEVASRYRRATTVLPAPAGPPILAVTASGLWAECCVWALEMLGAWGIDVRIDLDCKASERDALAALALRLGVAAQLGFEPGGPASLCLFLAMRGQASLGTSLAGSVRAGFGCIATATIAEAADLPGLLRTLPDQPSPPLLAEAVSAALCTRASPGLDRVATQLRATLGLAT